MTFADFMTASIIAAGLAFMIATAHAEVQINGHSYSLTEAQAAKLALDAANQADSNKQAQASPAVTVDEVSKYAELGKTIGATLAGTAKEMGVAVNDFAGTPVGIIATILIVYKLVGAAVMQLVASFIWYLVSLPSWFYIFRRTCMIKEVRKTVTEKGKPQKQEFYYKDGEVNGMRSAMFLILLVVVIIGTIVAFA